MEHIVHWIHSLLYMMFCGIMLFGLVIFFIDLAIQYILKGRLDYSKALGTVSKVLAATGKLVTAGVKRRR